MVVIIVPGNWGASDPQDVVAVVRNVMDHLNPHFTTLPAGSIHVVSRPDSNPEMAYRGNRNDPYTMFVNATDRLWARLAYQSAHEYCHILSDYDRLRTPGNQWFHESICEMASFFCLFQMAESWKTRAPYWNWADYAPHLKTYAEAEMSRTGGGLPAGNSLKTWMGENRNVLQGDRYARDLNRIVALQLLPLFQTIPRTWECVAHMPDTDRRFEEFLAMWEENVPAECRGYVQSIANLFS